MDNGANKMIPLLFVTVCFVIMALLIIKLNLIVTKFDKFLGEEDGKSIRDIETSFNRV